VTPEDKLRRAEARYQRASLRAEEARLAREDAIRDAAATGMSTRQIAQYVALTAQRVQQIVAK
jgi:hypothetical protein